MWEAILWGALLAVGLFVVVFGVLLRIVKKLHPMPFAPFAAPLIAGRLRQWVQPPRRVIDRSGIRPGMCVLEVGPAAGAVTVPLARRVGREGRVVCLELQPAMAQKLRAALDRPGNADLTNVAIVCADAQRMPLPDGAFDAAAMVEVLGEVPDRAAALRECLRVLRPGGLLAVTEMMIDPDYSLPATTERRGAEAGFRVVGRTGSLWDYTVVFERPPAE